MTNGRENTMTINCPYTDCTFQADTQDEVDDHIVYLIGIGDEDHTEIDAEEFDIPECDWFLGCHEFAPSQVKHPTIGWVNICQKHLDWLSEDETPNPTKFVPPLAAQHGNKVASIMDKYGLDDDDD